jgi:hypothetical protein
MMARAFSGMRGPTDEIQLHSVLSSFVFVALLYVPLLFLYGSRA